MNLSFGSYFVSEKFHFTSPETTQKAKMRGKNTSSIINNKISKLEEKGLTDDNFSISMTAGYEYKLGQFD